jgi:hypothetical protein
VAPSGCASCLLALLLFHSIAWYSLNRLTGFSRRLSFTSRHRGCIYPSPSRRRRGPDCECLALFTKCISPHTELHFIDHPLRQLTTTVQPPASKHRLSSRIQCLLSAITSLLIEQFTSSAAMGFKSFLSRSSRRNKSTEADVENNNNKASAQLSSSNHINMKNASAPNMNHKRNQSSRLIAGLQNVLNAHRPSKTAGPARGSIILPMASAPASPAPAPSSKKLYSFQPRKHKVRMPTYTT